MFSSRLLTATEAGERLSKSEYALAAWRRIGYGPRWVRLRDNTVFYDQSDLEEWLEAQKVGSIAEERERGRSYNGAAGSRRSG
jgi:predicted DNA-binding transcriptional regulator AlpA